MNELPTGWEMARLDDLVDVLDSRRVPVNATERAERAGEVPYYGATGQVGWIDEALFDEEIVLLGEDGAPFLDPSKPKAYLVSGPSWVNNHAHVLRARSETTSNRFLKYALDAADYRPHVNGTTRLKLTQKSMNAMPIPLPPLPEQERIVAAIEEHLSRLDAAGSALRSVRSRSDAGLAPLLATFLGSSGEGRRIKLGSVGRWSSGGTPRSSQPDYYDGDIPWAVIGDLNDGLVAATARTITRLGLEESSAKLIPPGSVLVAMYGSIGKLGITAREMATNQAIACVQPFEDLISRDYLFWLLRSLRPALIGMGKGAAQQNIGQRDLKSIEVDLPGLQEQQEAVARVEATLGALKTVDVEVERAIARAGSLRRSILAAAFSGQLVPQDPEDESASALLERIRAERASATPTKRTRKAKAS